jgi:hypothetical protein
MTAGSSVDSFTVDLGGLQTVGGSGAFQNCVFQPTIPGTYTFSALYL